MVYCSDPRYQVHCQDFVQNGLQLKRYSLLAIPGGVQTLTLVEYLPKFAWAGWRWMKFLTDLMNPDRIVLIAHHDCRWYFENRFVARPEELRHRQLADLRSVRAALIERFGPRQIDLFYTTLVEDRAVFEAVTASPQP